MTIAMNSAKFWYIGSLLKVKGKLILPIPISTLSDDLISLRLIPIPSPTAASYSIDISGDDRLKLDKLRANVLSSNCS
jgi:hypothetical protein